MIKRTFDFSLALLGIILSLPLWILISLAIFIEDGLPVLYSQERVGRNSKIFKALKFRSMINEAEKHTGPVQAEEDDLRVTKVGRLLRALAMDELPQLVNILRGDISFVGPRALRLEEKEVGDDSSKRISEYHNFKERIKIRPGLTGIAQVFAPRDISREEKFEYDLWYIKNRGFWLDIYIIMLSFIVTFKGKWESRKNKFIYLGNRLKCKVEKDLGRLDTARTL